MLKAKIDCTTYPVVRVESIERPVVPSRALHPLLFEPGFTGLSRNEYYLLYFKEVEQDDRQAF